MGEDDAARKKPYSGTVRCHSAQGTLFELPQDMFLLVKDARRLWIEVEKKIKLNDEKNEAHHLCNSPPRDFRSEYQRIHKIENEIVSSIDRERTRLSRVRGCCPD